MVLFRNFAHNLFICTNDTLSFYTNSSLNVCRCSSRHVLEICGTLLRLFDSFSKIFPEFSNFFFWNFLRCFLLEAFPWMMLKFLARLLPKFSSTFPGISFSIFPEISSTNSVGISTKNFRDFFQRFSQISRILSNILQVFFIFIEESCSDL